MSQTTNNPVEEFGDLAEFLTVTPKTLPINGVRYDFPGDVSARAYLVMQHVMQTGVSAAQARAQGREFEAKQLVLDDTEELDLRAEVFGDCAQEMLDDGVTAAYQDRAFTTLMVWHVYGRDAALAVWRGDASGEAPAPNRAARRSAARTSTGAATTTKPRASGSGTSSPKAPAPRAKRTA